MRHKWKEKVRPFLKGTLFEPVIFSHEEILESILLRKNHPNFFFIQVGANDGVTFDPIHDFIKRYSWSGILIEPISCYFNMLKENYKGSNVVFENLAVSAENEILIYHIPQHIVESARLPQWVRGISSLYTNKNALGGCKNLSPEENKLIKDNIISQLVAAATLKDICLKYHVSRLDLLQIDTEGHDFEVLQTLDIDMVMPEIIHMEYRNLTASERKSLHKWFKTHKFRIVYCGTDILAARNLCLPWHLNLLFHLNALHKRVLC